MKEKLDDIRRILDDLEVQRNSSSAAEVSDSFSAFELPLVIQEIVDDLQPLLTPYDAAFYWYLFRHSIATNGQPLLRVSTRDLRKGVVKSSYSYAVDNTISFQKVGEALKALEGIGAIRKDGEPIARARCIGSLSLMRSQSAADSVPSELRRSPRQLFPKVKSITTTSERTA